MTEKHPNRESAAKQYVAQRYYFGQIGHSAPLYLVLGNHDGESGRYLDGIVYQEVPQPGLRRYNVPRTAAAYGYVQGTILGGPLRVTVSPNQAPVDFVSSCLPEDETAGRRNGEVRDRYRIP